MRAQMGRWRVLPLAALLCGCTVGPDYGGPPAVAGTDAPSFHRAGEVKAAAGPMDTHWWTSLKDLELNRLEDAALAASPTVEQANLRLRQSRAGLREQRANQLPSTGTSAVYLRAHTGGGGLLTATGASGTSGSSTVSHDLDLYDVGFDASWEIDLFGGKRRAVEAARADVDAKRADLEAAQVSLTADVADAYVILRDVQNRLALASSAAELQGRTLGITRVRLAGGTASALDVERLNTQVQSTRADLVPLQAQVDTQLDRLAVLTGQAPGTLDVELVQPRPLPLPPETVTIADPAALLRRRPDIRAAERRIASQNAVVGERVADLFPKLTLFGNIGFGSTDLGQLLTGGSLAALGAPVLQWQPFDFGRKQARIQQAEAIRDEAIAEYRGTVLNALGDAETALSRYGNQKRNVAGLRLVKASADRAAALTRQRYAGGTATLIDTLDTERQRLQAEQALAQAEGALLTGFIGLQKSLGLGWTAN